MKKFLLLVMTLISATTLFAQNEEGEATVMIKGGMNVATLAGDPNAKARISYLAGLEFEYGLSDKFGLVAGVQYSDQGERDDVNDITWRLGNINVPLLCQYYIVKGLAVKAGVQLGFLVSKKATYKGENYDFDKLESLGLIPSEFRKFDLAIPMGISYEFANFVLDARYNLGLIGIFKESSSYEDNYRNRVFQLSLGYKIPFTQ